MRYVPAYSKTAATVYHLIAAASSTYGVLAMLLACYERNAAAGLLALIPAVAGIALGTALLGREDQKGGEAK